jgi:hypothetical protein
MQSNLAGYTDMSEDQEDLALANGGVPKTRKSNKA